MRVAILGFGREGKSLLKFLKKSPQFRGAEITILDSNPKIKIPSHRSHFKISHRFGKNYLKNLSRFDIIFRSPGVPFTLPEFQKDKKAGVEISSATKLFFEQLRGLTWKSTQKLPIIIGITGTKGKGTTSTLLAQILKRTGRKVILAGNIGKPMLDILPDIKKADYVILELSSFQLQDLPYSPHIAVVLDVFPDHLDQHKTLLEYYGSKANIGRFQKKSDAIFYFANNPRSKKIAFKSPARKIPVTPKENTLKKNYEMAATVARYLKCGEPVIQKTIENFKGLEHRLELVRTIKKHSNILQNVGISFYNDSAATNPNATAFAIRSFKNPIILIAGGKSKVPDYTPIAQAIKKSKLVKAVVLFGENKNEIKRALTRIKNYELRIMLVNNLKSAVKLAYEIAENLITQSLNNSITILLSPASASFDMFKNYADRGRKFKALVKSLKNP